MPKTYDPNAAYEKWRQRVLRRLPSIAARVDALDGVIYNGYGSQHDKHKEVTYLKRELGEVVILDESKSVREQEVALSTQLILQVRFEDLIEDLARAEKSAREYAKGKRQ